MDIREEASSGAPDEGAGPVVTQEPLPDLLGLDLDELRTLRHPVLTEVLEELRERAAQPSEMLWGFNNSF
ncbi:FxSxx-COOH cyclophane-containing RiPP peptide [Streptomyces sp. NPDC005708]|uniref:FxSxx-COOH cyclophane-containing RiPP peptide n=1 Tax=unclassified Streptomyces TaxID=2593676 RepID=UPI0033E839A8